jgi:peptidoglycan biosynthesis protein MviN/MurJ (putative lipid II flippase)
VFRSFLNARFSFIAPALMHAVMNGVALAVILVADGGVGVVAWAFVSGSLAQLIFVVMMSVIRGLRPVSNIDVRDGQVRTAARLTVRPMVGATLNPLVRIGEQLVVSYLPTGSITIVNYGYRLISAIGGSVLFRSVIAILLPRLSSAHADHRPAEFQRITRMGIKIMLAIAMPLTPIMVVLAVPATVALFGRGSFSHDDAVLLGVVLAVYSASLVGSGVQRAMLAPFFARLDTRTPLRNTAYGAISNLILVPLCVLPFGGSDQAVIGVAVAYSLAQYVNVAHAAYRLRSSGVRLSGIWSTVWRLALASAVAGAALIGISRSLDLDAPLDRWVLLARTSLAAVVGAAAFALVAGMAAHEDLRQLRRSIQRADEDPSKP